MIRRFSNDCVFNSQHLKHNGLIKTFCHGATTITLGFFALVLPGCNNAETPDAVVVPPATPVATPSPVVTPTVTVTATPTATVTATPTPGANATASPGAALPNANLVGENVTVSTKVQRVIAPNVFTVYDKESLRGQEVLVVSKQPAPAVGTNIELTGTVRNFVVADVNKEYGLNVNPDLVVNYVNKPYVAAKAIEKVN